MGIHELIQAKKEIEKVLAKLNPQDLATQLAMRCLIQHFEGLIEEADREIDSNAEKIDCDHCDYPIVLSKLEPIHYTDNGVLCLKCQSELDSIDSRDYSDEDFNSLED